MFGVVVEQVAAETSHIHGLSSASGRQYCGFVGIRFKSELRLIASYSYLISVDFWSRNQCITKNIGMRSHKPGANHYVENAPLGSR